MKTKKSVFVAVCLCTALLAQAQVKLSFNPAKGETYLYRFDTEMLQKQTINEQEMTMNSTMEMVVEMIIRDKSKSEISVDYAYKEIVMAMSAPMVNMTFDSKNSDENLSEVEKMMAKIFRGFIGKTMNIKFRPDGSVLSVSGFEAIMNDMINNMVSVCPPEEQQAMLQTVGALSQSFNDEAIKNQFSQSFTTYPDKKIRVGDSWSGSNTIAMAGLMNADMEILNTLTSIKNNVATIDAVSTFKFTNVAGTDGELSGESKGESTIDAKTGMLINSTSTLTLDGKLVVQGMEIPVSMVSKGTGSLQR